MVGWVDAEEDIITRMRPLLAGSLVVCLLYGQAPASRPLTGYTTATGGEQQAREKQFDAGLSRTNLQEWLKKLSARPHHLGSPAGKDTAEFIAAQFKSWGYQVEIETFYPVFPTPKLRKLEMTSPERFTAKLEEPVLADDSTSGVRENQLPVYNAYSIDGNVNAPLVYVNYGLPADYEILAEHGIDVKGKIVIARYGNSWRGIKPKVAAEHGAIGCLIYSDPHDDGYFVGDVYPKGGWRPSLSAQRGSVLDMPTYPGDPLTPGIGATKDAVRVPKEKAETITKIPVMPISYEDATPLLKALGGPVAPAPFRGSLPFTYHLGPGPAAVHLELEFDWKLTPAYDVIARLPGSEFPDEWVIRGNHHDGWVFGASDPLSGLVPMMEEARGVAELVKKGWKPRRTIVYTMWDGEEPMLLGSTEWVETHAKELSQKAAVYINSDGNGRGFVELGGSHTLEHFVNETARDVEDPERKVPSQDRFKAVVAAGRKKPVEKGDIEIFPLGSGSDFTPFLQHIGVATLSIGFGGEDASNGVYHSIYDSYDHFVKFDDPDFQYGIALAQLGGRTTMRLADAETLPIRFEGFARAVSGYVDELVKLADKMRTDTDDTNKMLADHTLELAADPHIPYIAPAPKGAVPYLSFAPLQNAVVRLKKSSAAFAEQEKKTTAALPLETRRQLDQILIQCDRALIREAGLPRRPWYKHQIYAPGYYTGYGVKTIPGVRESIEERNWAEAGTQIPLAAMTLEAMAVQIDKATALLAAQ
jgi:N-acetylated-alpha-linked acidic dipeptidase